MKKTFIFLSIILCTALHTLSQQQSYRAGNCKGKSDYCPSWSIFHETVYNFSGLGINSVNAEAIVFCNKYYMAGIRFGINYLTFPKISAAGIPVEGNFMIGRGAWMFETGLGLNYLYVYKNYQSDQDNLSYLALTLRAGVRYEKQNGLFFRAGYNPHLSLINHRNIPAISKHAFLHMLSVGIGYAF